MTNELQWTVYGPNGWVHGAESGDREYKLFDWFRKGRVRLQMQVGGSPGHLDLFIHGVDAAKQEAQRWDSMTESEICEHIANTPDDWAPTRAR